MTDTLRKVRVKRIVADFEKRCAAVYGNSSVYGPTILQRNQLSAGRLRLLEVLAASSPDVVGEIDNGSLSSEVCSDAKKLAREINDDPMGGEDEIAAAIQRGFNVHRSRVIGEIVAWLRNPETDLGWPFTRLQLADAIEARFGDGKAVRTPAEHDVLAERQRQISVEGWSAEHDDLHTDESLAIAAAVYALPNPQMTTRSNAPRRGAHNVPALWPESWDAAWYKPKDRRRDLVRAAALIVAEIERLDRLPPPPEDGE